MQPAVAMFLYNYFNICRSNLIQLRAVMSAEIVSPLRALCWSDMTSHPALSTHSMLTEDPKAVLTTHMG